MMACVIHTVRMYVYVYVSKYVHVCKRYITYTIPIDDDGRLGIPEKPYQGKMVYSSFFNGPCPGSICASI